MSLSFGIRCTMCKNSIPRNGELGETRCRAFPNGVPYEYLFEKDVTKLSECANGYKYEYDESKDVWKDIE